MRGDTIETVSRRTKLKNRVTEKFSMWRKKQKKTEDTESNRISSSSNDGKTDGSSTPGSPIASIQVETCSLCFVTVDSGVSERRFTQSSRFSVH